MKRDAFATKKGDKKTVLDFYDIDDTSCKN